MDLLISNPGLNHIALEIVGFLEFPDLVSSKLVNKQWNEFLSNTIESKAIELKWLVTKIKMTLVYGETIVASISDQIPEWLEVIPELKRKASLEEFDEVIKIVKEMIRDPDKYSHVQNTYSPMHFAVKNGYTKFLEIMLSTSMDFNICCHTKPADHHCWHPKYSVLHLALDKTNNADFVEFLLGYAKTKTIHHCKFGGLFGTVLEVAVHQGCLKIVNLLLDKSVELALYNVNMPRIGIGGGRTVVDMALKYSKSCSADEYKERFEIYKTLEKFSHKTNIQRFVYVDVEENKE